MTVEVTKGDGGPDWCVEINGRIISYGLKADEAERIAADWRVSPFVSSWRFAPAISTMAR